MDPKLSSLARYCYWRMHEVPAQREIAIEVYMWAVVYTLTGVYDSKDRLALYR